MRSANPEVTIAMVTVANTSWKTMYNIAGTDRAVGTGVHTHTIQTEVLQVTDEPANIRTECQRVSDQYPLETHQCKGDKRKGDHVDEILLSYQSAIE